jgi:hypothetical protein
MGIEQGNGIMVRMHHYLEQFCLDILCEDGVFLRPMLCLSPKLGGKRGDTVYADVEKVISEFVTSGPHGCTCHGGKR